MSVLLLNAEEMDFNIHVIKTFQIFGVKFVFTSSLWNALCIAIGITIFCAIVGHKVRKADPLKPQKGIVGLMEVAVEFLNKTTKDTMGPQKYNFAAFYGGLIIYIMVCNLSGLLVWFVPYADRITIDFIRPPTADIAVTLSMALITFFMTQGFAIKEKGVGKWLKALTEPVPFLTPINVIGEVANPISLSFRLMGNILAGTVIMGIYYMLLPYFAYIISPALHFYFDVFAGVLQSYIFMMLSMIYVSGGME